MKSVRTAFTACLAVAVIVIAVSTAGLAAAPRAATALQYLRAAVFLVFGIGPIVAYYAVVRKELLSGAERVGESSIDAVYYLGFLITLTTLLFTVIVYGVFGKTDNASVNVVFIGVSFALSLFATACALYFRIDLIQLREGALAADPEAVLRGRISSLDDAYGHLTSVMRDAASRFEQSMSSANTTVVERMSNVVEEAQSRLRDFVQAASQELGSSQRALNEASVAASASMSQTNAALFKQMADVIENARTSLTEFVKAAALELPAGTLAVAVNDLTGSLGKARKQIGELSKLLDGMESHLSSAVSSIDSLQTNLRHGSDSAAAMSAAFGKATSDAGALDVTPVHAGLAQLGTSVQRLEAATARAEQQYVAASGEAAGELTSRAKELTTATELLSEAFFKMAHELAVSAEALAKRVA